MAKFLNKKEQVFDLKLTSYGNYLLSQGNFKPTYYAFYDDNVIYDIQYASGLDGQSPPEFVTSPKELQNDIQRRIKDETSYIESFVLFEEVEHQAQQMTQELRENQVGTENTSTTTCTETSPGRFVCFTDMGAPGTYEETYRGIFASDYDPTQEQPRKDFFKFNAMIGDAYLDGDTQAAPAWKIITLQGLITSSATEDVRNRVKIPQINMDLKYIKEVNDNDFLARIDPHSISQIASSTGPFKDNRVVSLKLDDAVIYADEVNTELLNENFEIEVFEVGEYTGIQATGSIAFNDVPLAGNIILINDGTTRKGASQTFSFETTIAGTASAEGGFVEIGADAFLTMNNFRTVFNTVFASTMEVETFSQPNGVPTITFRNKNFGPSYNIPLSTDNTEVFTIQGMDSGIDGNNKLTRKYFEKKIPQIKNGLMLSERPQERNTTTLTSASIEYYFDILTDYSIDQAIACRGADVYNKESYYIDLDFDCTKQSDDFVYNDIYGYVTEPEVCLD
jgi:hypothetical protein